MFAQAGFPPSAPAAPSAIVLHVVLLGLAIASVAGLFVRSRPARRLDVFLWGTAALAAAVGALVAATTSSHYRSILLGYMLFVLAVTGIGCLLSSVRLVRAGRAPAVVGVLSSLLALGLLIGLVLPAVPTARGAARRMQCSNNGKELALALHHWHDEHGRFPDAQFSEVGQPPHSWRVALLPLLEQSSLYDQYHVDQPWDDATNLPVSQHLLPAISCPSHLQPLDAQSRYFTDYLLVTGPGTVFPDGKGVAAEAIDDGASNTLLVAEASGQNVVWTRPHDLDVRRDPVAVNLAGDEPAHSPGILSSYHFGGANAVMADGSVRFISETIDPQVLKSFTTSAAGDTPGSAR